MTRYCTFDETVLHLEWIILAPFKNKHYMHQNGSGHWIVLYVRSKFNLLISLGKKKKNNNNCSFTKHLESNNMHGIWLTCFSPQLVRFKNWCYCSKTWRPQEIVGLFATMKWITNFAQVMWKRKLSTKLKQKRSPLKWKMLRIFINEINVTTTKSQKIRNKSRSRKLKLKDKLASDWIVWSGTQFSTVIFLFIEIEIDPWP